jgi:hypothetical protein
LYATTGVSTVSAADTGLTPAAWRTLRVQFALLYAGFFFACGVAVLIVPVLTVHQSIPEGANAAAIAQIQANSRGQVIRAAVTVFGLGVLSLAVGWLISGRFLRPLRTITAIVRAIASAHGATLAAKARPEGGLDTEVSFPDRRGDGAAAEPGIRPNGPQ